MRERVETACRIQQHPMQPEKAALGVQHLALIAGVERACEQERPDR